MIDNHPDGRKPSEDSSWTKWPLGGTCKDQFFFKKACQVPLQAKSGNILALSSLNIFLNIFFVQYSIFDDVDYDMKFLLTFPTGMTLWQHGVRHPLGQLACQPVVGHHWVLWWESITVYTTTYMTDDHAMIQHEFTLQDRILQKYPL